MAYNDPEYVQEVIDFFSTEEHGNNVINCALPDPEEFPTEELLQWSYIAWI